MVYSKMMIAVALKISFKCQIGPLFQILFAYQNIKNPELKLKDLSSELEQINSGNTEFDISFILNIFDHRPATQKQ